MKSLVTSLLISAAILLAATQSASARPNDCLQFKEEEPVKETIIRKFSEFDIQIEVAANSNAVLLDTGEVLIVDRGTYKYLRCLQNNPNALGKGIFGILLSKGSQVKYELYNAKSLHRVGYDGRFIVYTKDHSYIAIRVMNNQGDTYISLYGDNFPKEEEAIKREVESLLVINKGVQVLEN
ncbi:MULTISPECIES: hypothetical protein [unclassified Anabaena]|uniref:hypothetical protein n=1 Tax=unclassified Anabaena TaxID=2619674 RepID=UPI0006AC4205|nr:MULTISPECIES: hypothetical protein [unclassified Anabaena]ALB39878.1 hypothetical protein AA650_04845 [Anabaena sp. WA102]OBQ17618.1 MAG: hypothetical protein AN486_14450 [Anabaena sp. AL93]